MEDLKRLFRITVKNMDFWKAVATIFFIGIVLVFVIKASNNVCQWFLCFISIQCCFYSIYNLNTLFGLSMMGHMQNDAVAMQNITMIPAPIWSVLWIVMSFIIFGFVLKLVWKSDYSE